ncbi:hypothetical protein ACOI1H_06875 [Loktanella sp. DJP18]|uniref:hypothetical protein n=1 Tax=Loktanella sp. DJP18 TaxID=3409788 RepID=UPI003BB4D535
MLELGDFAGDYSYAIGISGDGTAVIGQTHVTASIGDQTHTSYQAFRWTSDGTQLLGSLKSDGTGYSNANAVSADGAVVAGSAQTDGLDHQAFRWTDDGGMVSLGTLRADQTGYSHAQDMSADGTVVVGHAYTDSNSQQAFRWTSDGMKSLGTLRSDGQGYSSAYAVNADGTVVVGQSEYQNDQNHGNQQAFRWTQDGMIGLGTLQSDGSGYSHATAVSADGSVVAGQASTDTGSYQAFRWTAAGMQGLGSLRSDGTGYSHAQDLSADGSTVVGNAQNGDDTDIGFMFHSQRAFRWTQSDGMVDLGTLRTDGSGYSQATAVNGDGSVVVGSSDVAMGDADAPQIYHQAFRWTADGMVGLGTLKADGTGYSYAYDVSDDGTIVVGQAESDLGMYRAFIYRAKTADPTPVEPDPVEPAPVEPTPVDPSPVPPAPVEPTPVTPVSVDPTPVTPTPVVPTPVIPTPTSPGTMLDLVNTQAAIIQNASAQARVTQTRNTALVELMGRELELSPMIQPNTRAQISTKGSGDLSSPYPVALRLDATLRQGGDVDDMGIAGVTAAVGITPKLTFGGFLYQGSTSDGDVLSVGTSLRSRETSGTGLTWRAALGYARGDISFDRDDQLSNTESARGDTTITNLAASAEIGYGIADGPYVLTPFLRLSHATTTRNGYTEAGTADFPVTYESYEATATTLTLGADGRRDISSNSSIRFSAGVELDLARSNDPIEGTSEVPGLENISVSAPSVENGIRPYVSLGFMHALNSGSMVTLDVGTQTSAYSEDPRHFIAVGYQIKF